MFNKINSKQAAILVFAAILLTMAFLTPPWMYETDDELQGRRSAGYYLLTKPPPIKSAIEMREIFTGEESDLLGFYIIRRDNVRLGCECSAILLLAAASMLFVSCRLTPPTILAGSMLIILGIISVSAVLILGWMIRFG